MSRNREELRAALMKEAEEVTEGLLDWHEKTEAPSLGEMEEIVIRLRQGMSVRMVEILVEEQEAVHPAQAPLCKGCGERMRDTGEKGRGVGSWVGELRLKRRYYHCPRCQTGVFPPGSTVRD